MTQKHPITPPPELVREWAKNRGYSCADELWDYIATQAAQWGADQELDACCEWVYEKNCSNHPFSSHELRTGRRPKPQSLKELALEALNRMDQLPTAQDQHIIRHALEQLND